MSPDPLLLSAQACIQKLDPAHASLQGLDLGAPAEALIPAVAARTRAAVFHKAIGSLPDKLPLHYARKDETPEQAIDRCLAGTWVSVGRAYTFPQGLDYNLSPNPAWNTRGVPYGEWSWQINRHSEWRLAAQLYHETGDDKYAQAVAAWLRTWLIQCPRPPEDLNARQASWRTIEIGIRLAQSWSIALAAFRDASAFDDVLWLAWLDSWAEQADFVWTHRKQGNWLLMELNGLLHAGVLLPFMRDAQEWRRNALDAFVRQAEIQVHPDGFQYELSSGYQGVCVHNYRWPVQLLRAAGHDVPPAMEAIYKKMIQPWRDMVAPNGLVFAFQDAPFSKLDRLLRASLEPEAYEAYDRWFVDREGEPPAHQHNILPYAGFAVLRRGWHKDALAVAFDGGPYGAGHQHEDKLSIQVVAHGQLLVAEAGLVDYADTPERHYSLGTLAHSTALVDGCEQNRRATFRGKEDIEIEAEAGMAWDIDVHVPWVRATYDQGYGDDLSVQVAHTRTVALLSDDLVLLLDAFRAPDADAHRAELLFHLLVNEYTCEANGLRTTGPKANVAIASLALNGAPLSCDAVYGGTDPDLRGWATVDPDTPISPWTLTERPCLTVRSPFRSELTVFTAIQVFAPGAAATLPAIAGDSERVTVNGVVWGGPAG